MESSIAEFLTRWLASEHPPTCATIGTYQGSIRRGAADGAPGHEACNRQPHKRARGWESSPEART